VPKLRRDQVYFDKLSIPRRAEAHAVIFHPQLGANRIQLLAYLGRRATEDLRQHRGAIATIIAPSKPAEKKEILSYP
jgi:hypothetical protein